MANDTMKLNLGLEDSTFKKGMKDANKELKTLQQTARELAKDNSLEGLSKQAENSKKQIENLTKTLKSQKDELERLEKKTQEYRQELQKVDKGSTYYDELTDAIKRTEKRMGELKNEIDLTEAKTKSATNELKEMYTAIDKVGDKSDTSANQLGEINTKMDNMSSKIGTINKMDFGQNLIDAGQEILDVVGQIIEGYALLIEAGSQHSSETAQTEMVYSNLGAATQKAIDSQVKLADSFAQTETNFKSGATELASYYDAMGFTDEAIAQLLPSQMQLVSDMAAMANVPFSEALEDYKSALMGNHEAVDKYNIALGESTMNESDYAQSIGKTVSQMTEQEKIQSRANVMMEQSANYTGLAQEEAEEFTAQQLLLNDQLEELKGEIGEGLLPIFKPFVEKINEIVGKVTEWVDENPEMVETLGELGIAIGAAVAVIGTLIIVLGGLAIALALIEIVGAPVIGAITLIVLAIGLLVAAVVMLWLNWEDVCNWISEKWSQLCEWVTTKMTELKEWLANAWQYLCENIPIWIDNLKQWVSDKWTQMCEFVSTKASEIKDWVVNKFQELVEKASQFFSELPYNVGHFIGETLRKVIEWGTQMKDKAVETATNFLNSTIQFIQQLPSKIWTWLTNTIQKVTTWGSQMKSKATEAATNFINSTIQFIQQLPSKIWTWLVNTVNKITQWKSDMVSKGKEAARSLVDTVVNKIKELPSKVVSIGRKVVESIWSGITGAASWLRNKVSSFIDGIVDGFTGKDGVITVAQEYENDAQTGLPNTVWTYGKDFENKTISLASFDSSFTDGVSALKSNYVSPSTGLSQDFNRTFNASYQSSGTTTHDSLGKKLDTLIALLMKGNQGQVVIDNVNIDAREKSIAEIEKELSDYIKLRRRRW